MSSSFVSRQITQGLPYPYAKHMFLVVGTARVINGSIKMLQGRFRESFIDALSIEKFFKPAIPLREGDTIINGHDRLRKLSFNESGGDTQGQ
jgi:hypothetical protein